MSGQNLNTAIPEPAATSLTIPGLKPLTFCCVSVSAKHSNCSISANGPARESCSQTMDNSPNAVENFNLDVTGPTSMFARWDLPENYQRPGLTYRLTIIDSVGNSQRNEMATNLMYLFIGDLTPNTQYNVTITAASVQYVSNMSAQAFNTTLPPLPDAPVNPSLSLSSSETLTLSWTPQDLGSNAPIIDYTAVLRCNGEDLFAITTTSTMVDFNISGITTLTWCTAVLQGRNQIGVSDYSSQANIVIPTRLPSKPQCYFTSVSGANATITFTVTEPFSLEQTKINYTLFQSDQEVLTKVSNFNSNSENVIYVPVQRETPYRFQLSFCNVNGCGEYCDELLFNSSLVRVIT